MLRVVPRAVPRQSVLCKAVCGRALSTSADTVTVTIAEAQSKTAEALKKIGWDDEDAGYATRPSLHLYHLRALALPHSTMISAYTSLRRITQSPGRNHDGR